MVKNVEMYPLVNNKYRATTVVLADGDFPKGEIALSIVEGCTNLVCTDGAADALAQHSLTPCAIVGDCDSISQQSRKRFADILYKIDEQDSNDLTKAVEWCLARGWNDITILGATGKREDHTIANISLLADYMLRCRVNMVTDYGEFVPICSDTSFESFVGQQVSIYSLDPWVEIRYKELRYDLPENRAKSWWSGTLNECMGDEFKILTKGNCIIFRAF